MKRAEIYEEGHDEKDGGGVRVEKKDWQIETSLVDTLRSRYLEH